MQIVSQARLCEKVQLQIELCSISSAETLFVFIKQKYIYVDLDLESGLFPDLYACDKSTN